jgi:hypothetical protein
MDKSRTSSKNKSTGGTPPAKKQKQASSAGRSTSESNSVTKSVGVSRSNRLTKTTTSAVATAEKSASGKESDSVGFGEEDDDKDNNKANSSGVKRTNKRLKQNSRSQNNKNDDSWEVESDNTSDIERSNFPKKQSKVHRKPAQIKWRIGSSDDDENDNGANHSSTTESEASMKEGINVNEADNSESEASMKEGINVNEADNSELEASMKDGSGESVAVAVSSTAVDSLDISALESESGTISPLGGDRRNDVEVSRLPSNNRHGMDSLGSFASPSANSVSTSQLVGLGVIRPPTEGDFIVSKWTTIGTVEGFVSEEVGGELKKVCEEAFDLWSNEGDIMEAFGRICKEHNIEANEFLESEVRYLVAVIIMIIIAAINFIVTRSFSVYHHTQEFINSFLNSLSDGFKTCQINFLVMQWFLEDARTKSKLGTAKKKAAKMTPYVVDALM